jgi:FkbM family methyltransferase
MLGRTTDRLIARFGWRRGARLAAQLRLTKVLPPSMLVRVDVPLFAQPVRLRARTSDRQVLQELLREPVFDRLEVLAPRVIVDAGANIGLVSALFATRFPDSSVIALELDPGNYGLLRRNVAGYPNVRPVLAGLWSRATELVVENPQSAAWAYRAIERTPRAEPAGGTSTAVPAMAVDDVLRRYAVEELDVLKIDIEGGEREVFGAGADSWLPRVRCIIVELHDRLVPGCSAIVAEAVRDRFVLVHSGELSLYARRDVAPAFR